MSHNIIDRYKYNKSIYIDLLEVPKDTLNIKGGKSKKKWKTLIHNGVMFYPEYKPHNVPITYGTDKKTLQLNPEAEEFITYYVQKRYDKYRTKKFNNNFFRDWKKLLSPELKKEIIDFSQCDLSDIKQYNERKVLENNIRNETRDKYKYAIVDGIEQTIDNYIVEPPTIFIGRGNHPLIGSIKKRLYPKDIILNIGPDMNIPVPQLYDENDPRFQWGSIISDNTLEWIASWQNNVTKKYNYARFGRKSSFKMHSDESKYDKARLLKKKVKKIREKNDINMHSSDIVTRQLSTALFIIDRLALRIGNEKKDTEADTVGVTTLKIKNVSLLEDSIIKLDFLGKDSVRYVNKFKVPHTVYQNIKDFHGDSNKNSNDCLFDLINADTLNKYIKSFMKKLTSKVFRTFNASYLMQIELKKINDKYKDYNEDDKIEKMYIEYELANLKVAKLCNHQRVASSSSSNKLDKINNKIREVKLKINKLKKEKLKKMQKGNTSDSHKSGSSSNGMKSINKRISKLQKTLKKLRKKRYLYLEAKTLSSGTSKINYIDPRITIAFLKTNNIMDGINKFFNKSQQEQFKWAIETPANFKF